jgi:adenosylcobinamide-GDP ribazoletransferase
VVQLSGLLAALQFLTRVPIHLRNQPALERAVAWFPVAGALIGLLVGGLTAGFAVLLPPLVAAAMGVTVGLLLTGAFHEDGLGDVADAFGGGWTIEDRMRILKDSRQGTYGVAAISASILVRIVALGSLPSPELMFAACVAAHCLARAVALVLMAALPLARHSGLGVDYGQSSSTFRAFSGTIIGVALITVATGWWVAPMFLAALSAAGGVGWLAMRKIGGVTGDVLGAAEQVAECLVLVVISGLARYGAIWWA